MGLLNVIPKDAIAAFKDAPDDLRRNAEAFVKFLHTIEWAALSEELLVGAMRGIRRGFREWFGRRTN